MFLRRRTGDHRRESHPGRLADRLQASMQEMQKTMDLHGRNLSRGPDLGLTVEMSIQAMEEEISYQVLDLPRFASHLRRAHLPKLKRSSLVFVGSGDSYAAAAFAQELSKGEAVASDPYE